MCMSPPGVKKTCQEVISLIGKVEDIKQKVEAEGCSACQGFIALHSESCKDFFETTAHLGKKLLKLQRQINGVICFQWIPKGLEYVADQDAINHSFDLEFDT